VEYSRWLLAIGQRVAHAASEGGFLSIGAKEVSRSEEAALHTIAAALGVTPSP
jgi:hypothetical protein